MSNSPNPSPISPAYPLRNHYQLGPLSDETPVFLTQHSTPENQAIAEKGLILLTEVGSTLHGVSDPSTGDDVDEMGICLEPRSHVIGLSHFEQYEFRTQPVNVRSQAGDIDRCVYSLRKWAKLASAGNPTVLMPLFAPVEKDRYVHPLGQKLLMSSHLFLSKQAGRKFLGYLDGQRSRYLDPGRQDSKHASRPELVEKYGWDTKTGYHAIRLALQGKELMQHHTIVLPMRDCNREFLLRVRQGEFSKEEVTRRLDERYIPMLKQATEESTLPDTCDMAAIDRFLISVYEKFWDDQDHSEWASGS